MEFWLLLTFAFTAFNTGLIWVIQVVHYPSFLHIDEARYEAFQKFHMKGITMIVLPSMAVELVSSGVLLLYWDQLPSLLVYIASVVLLGLIWLHTAFLASPIHVQLSKVYLLENIQKLIRINWWRTIIWSVRAVLVGYLLWLAL